MALKLFKAVWFLSLLAVFANLLYVYAGLNESLVIQESETGKTLVNREFFFYVMTGVILIVNVLVYLVAWVQESNPDFRSWFYGFVVTINIFLIFGMSVIQIYNSGEVFNFSKISFIIYGSVGLIIAWSFCWPAYLLVRRFYPKHAVS